MQPADECFKKVKNEYLNFLSKEKILNKSKTEKIAILKKIYIHLSFWIEKKYRQKGKILFLGISGGQGTGKTTATSIIKIILKIFFKREICITSIDDFYKTAEDRTKMSKKIHPLFKTRGVPGTHEINLLKKFFHQTKKKNFEKFRLPKFDKSTDNRFKKKHWTLVNRKPQIVILEGWCIGAKPQPNKLIKKSINILEKNEDKKLIWRKHVNNMLKNEYKKIFSIIDHYIFMKIPNFNMVFKWRLLQESKLKKKSHFKKKIMSYNEIKRFIMFYERITLQMIKDLSKSASVIMLLNKNHVIKKALFKN